MIYAIGLVDSHEEENPGILRRLCRDTSGLAFFPGDAQSVSDVSASIAHDIGNLYTIGLVPEKRHDDSFRKVRVEVKASGRGKLQIRTRSGYFATSPMHSEVGAGKDRS